MSQPTENQKKLRLLVAKASSDAALAQELINHPEKVPTILQKHGINLKDVTITFVQAKKDEMIIAIPHPDDVRSLSGGLVPPGDPFWK